MNGLHDTIFGMRLSSIVTLFACVAVCAFSVYQAIDGGPPPTSATAVAGESDRIQPPTHSRESGMAAFGSPILTNAAASPRSQVKLTPIEQLTVGRRVKADAPTTELDLQFGVEVVSADWRKLTLLAPKRDGSTADVILLRPLTWLHEQHAEVGGTVFISVPECGIDGHAQVLAIEPCPPIESAGDLGGRVITGTFQHQVSASISLSIAGQAEPILCTGNHPFWSEDRQDFVRADSLQSKETLRTTSGSTIVTSLTYIPGSTSVYNLEIHGTHVYHVGSSGVLVHNGGGLAILGGNCFWPKLDGHHALSKFLGGDPDQFLSFIPRPYHRELHTELARQLKAHGFPNVGGIGGSSADWARYFAANPGSQREAFDILFNVTREIDLKYGTNILSDLWKHIIDGSFRSFP